MGWCQSNRLKHHFVKTQCYSEYLYLAGPVRRTRGSTRYSRDILARERWCLTLKRDNLSDIMTGSNLSSLWDAGLLHCSTQAALDLWKSSSKQGSDLQQVEAGVTHILPVSARVTQMKNLSLGWKYKEEFPSTLSATLLITTNFGQMMPYCHITLRST